MGKYLFIGSYTAEGMKGLVAEGGSARRAATDHLFTELGGKVLEYGFLMGDHDFMILAEMPDEVAALAAPLIAGATGTVEVSTRRVLEPEVLDQVMGRAASITFRPAGHPYEA